MFHSKSRPIASENEAPTSTKKGISDSEKRLEKRLDKIVEVLSAEIYDRAIEPLRKLRKQVDELKEAVGKLRNQGNEVGHLRGRVVELENIRNRDHGRIDVLASLSKRRTDDIEQLLTRLERELETTKTATAFPFKYLGVWKQGAYRMNEAVTHKGCMWIALVSTEARPGDGKTWQLCVKAGRDGKDAKA
jgi:Mg2+ and Co2+ transporter CorA